MTHTPDPETPEQPLDVRGFQQRLLDRGWTPDPVQAMRDSSARLVAGLHDETMRALERLIDDERVPRCPRCLERVTGVTHDDSVNSRADAGAWVVQLTRLTTLQPCGHVLRPTS